MHLFIYRMPPFQRCFFPFVGLFGHCHCHYHYTLLGLWELDMRFSVLDTNWIRPWNVGRMNSCSLLYAYELVQNYIFSMPLNNLYISNHYYSYYSYTRTHCIFALFLIYRLNCSGSLSLVEDITHATEYEKYYEAVYIPRFCLKI